MNYEELEQREKDAEKLLNPDIPEVESEVDKKVETEPEKQDTPPEKDKETLPPDKEKKPEKVVETKDEDLQSLIKKAEQKYKTLEGKYNAEVPRTLAENKQLKEKTVELENKIAELEKNISSAKTVQQSAEIDAEIEELELDYPKLAAALKKFKATTLEQINALKDGIKVKADDSVNDDIKSVKTDVQDVKFIRFDLEMNKLGVPDWQEIDNNDDKFKEWLNEKVPYTDETKLQLLKKAASKHDAVTVSQFFLDYKKTLEASPEKEDGQEKLKKYVAPPKGGQNAPLTGVQSDLTLAKYKKFMTDTTGDNYRFDPKEWGGKTEAQVEQMFNDAISKGVLR